MNFNKEERLVLRAITDSIYDLPSIRGKLSLQDIADLSLKIYSNLNNGHLLHRRGTRLSFKTNPVRRYEQYCNLHNMIPKEEIIEVLDNINHLTTIGKCINGKYFIEHNELLIRIPKRLLNL